MVYILLDDPKQRGQIPDFQDLVLANRHTALGRLKKKFTECVSNQYANFDISICQM